MRIGRSNPISSMKRSKFVGAQILLKKLKNFDLGVKYLKSTPIYIVSERKTVLIKIVTKEGGEACCRARDENRHFFRYYKKLKYFNNIAKGFAMYKQGGNYYDSTTQHYIYER